MSQRKLCKEMDAAEIYEWMAYNMLKNSEFKEKINKELILESQKSLTDEQRSKMIIDMFKSIEKKTK